MLQIVLICYVNQKKFAFFAKTDKFYDDNAEISDIIDLGFLSKKGESNMTRKIIIGVLALYGFAAVCLAGPTSVKADALPCTVEYLNQAKEFAHALPRHDKNGHSDPEL